MGVPISSTADELNQFSHCVKYPVHLALNAEGSVNGAADLVVVNHQNEVQYRSAMPLSDNSHTRPTRYNNISWDHHNSIFVGIESQYGYIYTVGSKTSAGSPADVLFYRHEADLALSTLNFNAAEVFVSGDKSWLFYYEPYKGAYATLLDFSVTPMPLKTIPMKSSTPFGLTLHDLFVRPDDSKIYGFASQTSGSLGVYEIDPSIPDTDVQEGTFKPRKVAVLKIPSEIHELSGVAYQSAYYVGDELHIYGSGTASSFLMTCDFMGSNECSVFKYMKKRDITGGTHCVEANN